MSCQKYLSLISDLVEGELEGQDSKSVNLHIVSCQSCKTEYEALKGEKEIYSRFLFEIEPPSDLSENFQTRLESENQNGYNLDAVQIGVRDLASNLFGLWNFKQVIVLLMAVGGFTYFWLAQSFEESVTTTSPKAGIPYVVPTVNSADKDFAEKLPNDGPLEIAKARANIPPALKNESQLLAAKQGASAVKYEKTNRSMNFEKLPRKLAVNPGLSAENRSRFAAIRAFELETAMQIEKVEMLLRSFRNARFDEVGAEYDIAYERQQASRLLGANMQLRDKAVNYGSMMSIEILSKVEPYLLEISNLDNNNSAKDVIEIKQRVKNQNVIASLQSF